MQSFKVDSLLVREEFAIKLRKKKKAEILGDKRLLLQRLYKVSELNDTVFENLCNPASSL